MIGLSGLSFEVDARVPLSAEERDLLASFDQVDAPPPAFVLSVVDRPPFDRTAEATLPGYGEPALIECQGTTIRLAKKLFCAELSPAERLGRFYREPGSESGLLTTLKVALATVLPFEGGLPLHAAAVVRSGAALAFFGESGAGKSTIAGLSPHPVLSDELVAVLETPQGFIARATGFWGTLDRTEAPRGSFDLHALFALAKGSALAIDELAPREAFRALLKAALVPPAAPLWSRTLGVLDRLSRSVPVRRLTWSPGDPPWNALETFWR